MSELRDPFEEMDVVSALLNDGIEQGYLTFDQIMAVVPEVEENIQLLETIMEEVQAAGLTIYENEDEVDVPAIPIMGSAEFDEDILENFTFAHEIWTILPIRRRCLI